MGSLREALTKCRTLGVILALAVCTMLCGAKSLYAISQWDRNHGVPVAQALRFTRHQTRSVATLHRLFRALNREVFERVLGQWLQDQVLLPEEALALDGKQLRGIQCHRSQSDPVPLELAERLKAQAGKEYFNRARTHYRAEKVESDLFP